MIPVAACCPEGFTAVGVADDGLVCLEDEPTGRAVLELLNGEDGEICGSLEDPSVCCPPSFTYVGIYWGYHAICLEDPPE